MLPVHRQTFAIQLKFPHPLTADITRGRAHATSPGECVGPSTFNLSHAAPTYIWVKAAARLR